MLYGVYVFTTGEIFTALEAGVDVFGGSYILAATESGKALTFANSTSYHESHPFEICLEEEQ